MKLYQVVQLESEYPDAPRPLEVCQCGHCLAEIICPTSDVCPACSGELPDHAALIAVGHISGSWKELTSLRARVAEIAELEAENAALRESNKVLHRRCQSAESGLRQNLDRIGVRTLGRALANSAATMYRAKVIELEARVAELEAALGKAGT